MVRSLLLLAAIWGLIAGPTRAAEPTVRPAADGIFAAFETHPLVGLGDAHDLAEEGRFYEALVRDPRFAAQVGNVVVETASAAHQATLDRYLNGEDVPRAELRRVWSDAVGWATPPTAMYQEFLAAVRDVNRTLRPPRRIRVWAGEPPADWSAIKRREDLFPFLMQRDPHAARIIEAQILARGKKALVIYGGLHFFPLPGPPGAPPRPSLKGLVEQGRPGAFYIVQPYFGFVQPGCASRFEAATRWPPGSLVFPVKGTVVEALLLTPGCTVTRPPSRAPGAPPISPEDLARLQAGFARPMSGADADALLYLGPAAGLTRSPDDPDLATDPAYAAEIARRLAITGAAPGFLNRLATAPRPYRTP